MTAATATASPIPYRGLITILMVMSTTMVTLDTTVATVALPNMQASLSGAPDTISWVLTSYMIASAISTPLTGWLDDHFGRRTLVLTAIAGFTLTSIFCGIAANLEQLVIFRTIQGVFGAFIVPMTQALILENYPGKEQSKGMGFFSLAQLGPILGPWIGGTLTDALNWRWVFYINIPLGLIALAGLWFCLPAKQSMPRRFDIFGFAFVALGTSCFQLVLDRGSQRDWFSSTEIIVETIIAVICVAILIVHVSLESNTVPDRRLVTNRTFVCGFICMGYHGALMTASAALVPQMLQHVFSYTPTAAGLAVIPRGISAIFGTWLAGRVANRINPKLTLAVGYLVNALGYYSMSTFSPDMGITPVLVSGVVQGIGAGIVFVPLVALAFSSIDKTMMAEASSVFSYMRNLFSAIFVSIPVVLLTQNVQINHAEMAGITTIHSGISQVLGRADPTGIIAVRLLDAEINRQAMMISYLNDYLLVAYLALSALPLVFLMKWKKPARSMAEPEASFHINE